MVLPAGTVPSTARNVDHLFQRLTRGICPECGRVIDAQLLLRGRERLHAQAPTPPVGQLSGR